jgi:hypothetical protein
MPGDFSIQYSVFTVRCPVGMLAGKTDRSSSPYMSTGREKQADRNCHFKNKLNSERPCAINPRTGALSGQSLKTVRGRSYGCGAGLFSGGSPGFGAGPGSTGLGSGLGSSLGG